MDDRDNDTLVNDMDAESEIWKQAVKTALFTPTKKFKQMASVFWDCKGSIMIDYQQQEQTLMCSSTSTEYSDSKEKSKKNSTGSSKQVTLVSYCFKIKCTCAHLKSYSSRHSPDWWSTDLSILLIPKIKSELCWRHFASNDEVIGAI